MKHLVHKLEDFFSAFDSDEAIDLAARKRELLELAAGCRLGCDELAANSSQLKAAREENGALRSIIAQDCRAKLILLGDGGADEKAGELLSLPVSELREKREAILNRFDKRFSVAGTTNASCVSPSGYDLKKLHEFQS